MFKVWRSLVVFLTTLLVMDDFFEASSSSSEISDSTSEGSDASDASSTSSDKKKQGQNPIGPNGVDSLAGNNFRDIPPQ
jgi:hypothetical protein